MDITTKSGRFMAELKSTTMDTKAPNGSFTAILSVPTLDRDKEVVDAKAFEPLPAHITIDVDHYMTVEKTIGSGRPFYDGDALMFEGTFASTPLAQMVRTLVDEGHIKTMSVAYADAQFERDAKDGRPHLRKAELLNAGIVGIPSNREALITASKSLAATVAEVTDAGKPADGAEPDALAATAAGDLGETRNAKSIVGSFEYRSDRIRQALRAAYPLAQWVWVRATFDDTVVFEVELADAYRTFEAPYSITDGNVTVGDATEVTVAEVIVPGAKSPNKIPTATTPEPDAAAKAAASAPAAVDVAALTARARARAAVTATALL